MHYQRWVAHTDPAYEPKRHEGCSVTGCERPHKSGALCSMHYQRLLRYGDPAIKKHPVGVPETERFWMKVVKAGPVSEWRPRLGPCWIWIGSSNREGYGNFWAQTGRCVKAHRWAYEKLVGPIPEGLYIDHLCHRPGCVNPAHLEPVTNGENVRRGNHWARTITHCPSGHPYDEANVYIERGRRRCRTCRRERQQRRDRRRRLDAALTT
jgi:hypothetical protein